MGSLHNPSARRVRGICLFGGGFLFSGAQMHSAAPAQNLSASFLPATACVQTEILLLLPSRRNRSLHTIKGGCQQFDIRHVGSADDNRERDAMTVCQHAAFASLFSPDPWDWLPRTPSP